MRTLIWAGRRALSAGVVVLAVGILGSVVVSAQYGPWSAQIQNFYDFLRTAPQKVTGTWTFQDIVINGTCTGPGCPGGGGGISGTIAAGQVAVGSGVDTIGGSQSLIEEVAGDSVYLRHVSNVTASTDPSSLRLDAPTAFGGGGLFLQAGTDTTGGVSLSGAFISLSGGSNDDGVAGSFNLSAGDANDGITIARGPQITLRGGRSDAVTNGDGLVTVPGFFTFRPFSTPIALLQIDGQAQSVSISGLTYPTADAMAGYVVTTDGAGTLSLQAPGGGGGSPGAPTNSLQYNDGGTFAGSASLIVSPGSTATIQNQNNPQASTTPSGLSLFQQDGSGAGWAALVGGDDNRGGSSRIGAYVRAFGGNSDDGTGGNVRMAAGSDDAVQAPTLDLFAPSGYGGAKGYIKLASDGDIFATTLLGGYVFNFSPGAQYFFTNTNTTLTAWTLETQAYSTSQTTSTTTPAPALPTTAPSLDGTGAGNVSNGDHRYVFTWGNSDGSVQTTPSQVTATVTVVDNTVDGKIRVPIPYGCDILYPYLSIYRDLNGDGNFLLVNRQSYLCGTAFDDNVADGWLGGNPPLLNTAVSTTAQYGNQLQLPWQVDAGAAHWTLLPSDATASTIYILPPDQDSLSAGYSVTFGAGNGFGHQGGDLILLAGSGVLNQDVSPTGGIGGSVFLSAGNGSLTRAGNMNISSGLGESGAADGLIALSIGANERAKITIEGVWTTERTFTVGTLPTCDAPHEGGRTQVSDALTPAFLTAVVGGGAVWAPVICNGTDWVVN